MKILYLTKYSRLGASSRLRSYQYFPFLEKEGFKITVKPLFDDFYLNNLYKGKKSKINIIKAYLNRFLILFTLKKYNQIIIEKELFPYLPPFFERVINFSGIKYIVDYDDAIFHNYDLSKNKIIHFFLSKKINFVMKWSSHVIAGNSYLANKAKNSGAKNVTVIPTVIDLKRYEVNNNKLNDKFIIGWIGSPSTFKYVKNIKNALKKIVDNYNVNIHIIGAKENLGLGDRTKFIKWSEDSEVFEIQKFDIGIMPLEDSPWEKGKCSYKLIQYMGCGIPVIASPVGMNIEVVKDNENGFLANTEEDWYYYIEKIIKNKKLTNTLGDKGRLIVKNNYSLELKVRVLKNIINSLRN